MTAITDTDIKRYEQEQRERAARDRAAGIVPDTGDLMELAMGIISNGRDWLLKSTPDDDEQAEVWRAAARRWIDQYQVWLNDQIVTRDAASHSSH